MGKKQPTVSSASTPQVEACAPCEIIKNSGDNIAEHNEAKGLARRTSRHRPIDQVDKMLLSFGFRLTSVQLTKLGDLLDTFNLQPPSPRAIFSSKNRTTSNLIPSKNPKTRSSPTVKPNKLSSKRLWRFGKSDHKRSKSPQGRSKDKVRNNDSALMTVNLREIEICQQIGCGGSSAGVFLCVVDGWSCAMKQLKRELVCGMDIKCFEREMDILYRLPPHPNIVRYLFHTTHDANLCLFMQLYSDTLRDYLDERRTAQQLLPVELISEMALEIASGIQFLHHHGVIHRDIKAGNIFMTRNENGEITKLAVGDFDTSLRVTASVANFKGSRDFIQADPASLHGKSSPSNLFANIRRGQEDTMSKRSAFAQNKPRSTVGTTNFMAPEVLGSRNSTPYGFKADVYSFGMVLYELITLKLPFEQLDTCDIITAVLEGEAVPSLEMDDSIREKYWQLVELHRRCTAYNPSDRPTWTDILRSLHFIRRGADEKPAPLLSQKSQLSLSDQLNLYNTNGNISMSSHPGDLLSPHRPHRPPPAELPEALPAEFEMPEPPSPKPAPTPEVQEPPKSEPEPFKNATLRFRGVHSANTDTNEEESESETQDEQSDSETSESSTIRNRLMVRKVILEIRNEQGDVIREQLQEERSIEAAAKKGVQNISGDSSPLVQSSPASFSDSPARKKKKKIKRDRSVPSSLTASLSSPEISVSGDVSTPPSEPADSAEDPKPSTTSADP